MLRHKLLQLLKASCVQRYFLSWLVKIQITARSLCSNCYYFSKKLICDQYCHLSPYLWLIVIDCYYQRFLVNLFTDLWVLLLYCKVPLHVLWSGNFRRKFEANIYLILFLFFKDHSFMIPLFQYLQILPQFLSMFLNLFIRKISFLMVMMMIITVYYSCKYSFCKMKMECHICSGLDKNPRS